MALERLSAFFNMFVRSRANTYTIWSKFLIILINTKIMNMCLHRYKNDIIMLVALAVDHYLKSHNKIRNRKSRVFSILLTCIFIYNTHYYYYYTL